MNPEFTKAVGIVAGLLFVSFIVWTMSSSDVIFVSSGTSEPPNLYELTRQTAENTRHIFWLLFVGFAAWSFRSYKTGK